MVSRSESVEIPACTNRLPEFTRAECLSLAGLYGVVGLLHVAGWGLYLHYALIHPALVGLGLAAYMFGLRHAFDADHIAAVDDTARILVQKGKRPLGVGFFFSLGHATVVLLLALAIIIAADAVKQNIPELRSVGSIVGSCVSGIFLWIIGILNVMILLDIRVLWHKANSGHHSHAHLEELLARRGLLNRFLGGRFSTLLSHTWQMFPLGLLFGLGFDTASEVGLLGMTAGASVGKLPVLEGLSLPLLFAAGMSLMDTTDGILMVKAYEWAYTNPLRKIFYNFTTTGFSAVVALVIGTVELLQVMIGILHLNGPTIDRVAAWNIGALGYFIVGAFLITWAISVVLWRSQPIVRRYGK